ncbi:MAG: hydrolase [Rhodospirillales bacterium 70-18]|mgnify:CR=1 FL=1|nr:amidohydrolase [Rhodospirillales bacterium]OJY77415.1 MAG: hydrolase [Rhodospirillales bacterium 70-18]
MTIEIRPEPQLAAASRPAIADCDIHHSPKSFKLLYPYMAARWRDHLDMFGQRSRQGNAAGPQYPKGQPDASRRDAWPPGGGRPGSDLAFMQRHHLDANGITLGVLNMIRPHPGGFANIELSIAVCRAINDWQMAEWTGPEQRLKASLVVPYEDAAASVAEIERWAGHPDVVQVLLLSRTLQPLGARRYWPIYEAAAQAGLPVGIHAFGNGGNPVSSHGWPSFYIEDMVGHAQSCQAVLTSLVVEGVFARIPALKLVLIEAGFAWLPALAWRLDRAWARLRSETPWLMRLPSDYIRAHVWLTTQPMEEPGEPAHLADTIGWIGWDRLLFATDYPHWDYDDPATCLPLRPTEAQRQAFFMGNAREVYGEQKKAKADSHGDGEAGRR